jgi:hypothetical protein
MSSITSEIRNGINNTARILAHDALDRIKPPASVKYRASLAIDALTTPIHLGRNATDLNKDGQSDWDAKSIVIGTSTAQASNGTAIAIGKAKAGKNSNAISVRDKAQSGKGGTSVSLSAKGANSAGKERQAYSSTYDVNKTLVLAA